MSKLNGLVPGRIVNYVLAEGEVRPLMVVRVWDTHSTGSVNGVLFRDGTNDERYDGHADANKLTDWKTSVVFDESKAVGTWHWPERAPAVGQPTEQAAAA